VATPNTAAAFSSRRVHGRWWRQDTISSAAAAPATRNQATVDGPTSSKMLIAMVAPMYCVTPLSTNSASGEAVSR
jgi:hypothetical protein